jgi:CRISPR-associated endonuclease/helicase Cas3
MALRELVMNYNCTVVLATATQSSLDEYFKPLEVTEIVPNPREMYELFRRVTYVKLETLLSDEDLVNMMRSHDQALCVVNTRKKAQILTELLEEALIEDKRQISGEYMQHESNQRFLMPGIYHLSTTMVPVHRTQVLNEIREKLYNGETCRVISTSMIEAGVNISFPAVYRE